MKAFFNKKVNIICDLLESELIEKKNLKFRFEIRALYFKISEEELEEKYFFSNYSQLCKSDFISSIVEMHFDDVIEKLESFILSSSGWSLYSILCMFVHVVKMKPLRGSSYIALPKRLLNSKRSGILNIKNRDCFCFLYCIAAALYPETDLIKKTKPETYKKHFKNFITTKLSFPLDCKFIPNFEKLNKHLNISINVYDYSDGHFSVLRTTKEQKHKHIDLLIIHNTSNFHYCLVTDFSSAFRSSITKDTKKLEFICKQCLQHFYKEESYKLHLELTCTGVSYTFKEKEIKFKNFSNRCLQKFVSFGDTESLLTPISNPSRFEENKSYTVKYQKHVPFAIGFSWYSFNNDSYLDKVRLFYGVDCVESFVNKIEQDVFYIYNKYYSVLHPRSKISEEALYYLFEKNNKQCHICLQNIDFNDVNLVLDHDHTIPKNSTLSEYRNCKYFIGNNRVSNITLEIMDDVNMITFIDRGIRGGFVGGNQILTTSNNSYDKDYDSTKPESQIIIADFVGLYSFSMVNYKMPVNQYEWVEENELKLIEKNLSQYANNEKFTYIIEANISYPKSLHDAHNSWPLLCERKQYKDGKIWKLVQNLYDKKNYVAHINIIHYAVTKGLILENIVRAIRCTHSFWLRDFIGMNNEIRLDPNLPKFYSTVIKMLSNATFGKMIESLTKRRKIKLITNEKDLIKYAASPHLKNITVFNENLLAVELVKDSIVFNRPRTIGLTILENSKLTMQEYYYDKLKSVLGDISYETKYGDTDSIFIYVQGNMMALLNSNKTLFDTSIFPKDNKFGIIPRNRKKNGCLQIEHSEIVKSLIFLSSKQYAVKFENDKTIKKSKGTAKALLNKLTYEDYYNMMHEKAKKYLSSYHIRSKKLELFTIKQNKSVFNFTCNKRHFKQDGSSLAFGHYSILDVDPPFYV
ncbi:unnamed protein product [Chironomus riparius]|uniref:DNA-directed DNA polymerase n=1 Tax=Chironomus riparius TaxID=315576 RepID=A0A9N9WS10_9DIPT|nr:unnamed protein product [Chironomus riparius]